MVGAGLFETLRFAAGRPCWLARHQARLARSWGELYTGAAPELARLLATWRGELPGEGLVRVTFVGAIEGAADRAAPAAPEITVRPLPVVPTFIVVGTAERPRLEPPAVRRLKLWPRAWADGLVAGGSFETIVWNPTDGLLEGTRTNLFLLRDGMLVTPAAAAGLVAGVVREQMSALAGQAGLRVEERRIDAAEVRRAEGLLLTGVGVGVVAVDQFDGRSIAAEKARHLAQQWWNELRQRARDEASA